jgi:hypothetical protein
MRSGTHDNLLHLRLPAATLISRPVPIPNSTVELEHSKQSPKVIHLLYFASNLGYRVLALVENQNLLSHHGTRLKKAFFHAIGPTWPQEHYSGSDR